MSHYRPYTLLALLLAVSGSTQAQQPRYYSQMDFGGVGLLQTPTARTNPEGHLSFHWNRVAPYRRYGVFFQPFDRLEVGFRYTDIDNLLYGPAIAGDQSYKDKSIDIKWRLWDESYWLPAVAIGMRDIGGTSLFSSEYLVASKRVGSVDASLGLGWGQLSYNNSINNPNCDLLDRFCQRSGQTSLNDTGSVDFGDWFSGPSVGVFGGIEWHTPWTPLSIKLEYDSNDYTHEFRNNPEISQDSPWNLGMVWRLNDTIDVQLGWERGNTAMASITAQTNFVHRSPQAKIDPALPRYQRQPITEMAQWQVVVDELNEQGFSTESIARQGDTLQIAGKQTHYRDPATALQRSSAVLANRLPEEIKQVTLIEAEMGLTHNLTTLNMEETQRFHQRDSDFLIPWQQSPVPLEDLAQDSQRLWTRHPKPFDWRLYPDLDQSIGGPDGFFLYDINLVAEANYHPRPWLELSSAITTQLVGNLDDYQFRAPSGLPRVRTDLNEYYRNSRTSLTNLQLSAFHQFNSRWYGQWYGGMLERMFGGVGGELLYRPSGAGWAMAVDLNWVRQRDFEDPLGWRDYDVITGFFTSYWELPWKGTQARIGLGRFLAGDKGIALNFRKTFGSGVTVGTFAHFTDATKEEYGEGSFTKGFYLSIPFDEFFLKSDVRQFNLGWSPLTRDGGQMLERRNELFYQVDGWKVTNAELQHH